MPKANQPRRHPTDARQAHHDQLVTWLQAEQGDCLLNIAKCRAKDDGDELIYWARRQAQLAIAQTVAGWFAAHATI